MADYEITNVNPDGTSVMLVDGVEFVISPKCLSDEEWEAKLQAKANIFAEMIP